ncbi:unnamed protein product [Echinostoma caproni]|uniref:Uncharacterized protein n=1 Tax=Echinostoma caproni TaxID=27848 RepID=A0A183B440_9TREM|nr:unnamed protein product [Echinostoma caproni]
MISRLRGENRLVRGGYHQGRAKQRTFISMFRGPLTRRSLVSQAAALYMQRVRHTQKVLCKLLKLPVTQPVNAREQAIQVERQKLSDKAEKSPEIFNVTLPLSTNVPLSATRVPNPVVSIFPRASYTSTSVSADYQPHGQHTLEDHEFTEMSGYQEQVRNAHQDVEAVQQECFIDPETPKAATPFVRTMEYRHRNLHEPTLNDHLELSNPEVLSPQTSFHYEDEVGSFSEDSTTTNQCESHLSNEKQGVGADIQISPPVYSPNIQWIIHSERDV